MNVLAVGCHPDDLDIGCGGTLAKLAEQGCRVVMCIVAGGDMGHAVIMPDELRAIRKCEAEAAAKLIGAEMISLGLPDLHVKSDNDDLVRGIADVIRRTEPQFIITHGPDDYMKDHVEVGKAVFDASFSSSVPHFFPDNRAYGHIAPIFHMDTLAGVNFLPTEYVDITGTIETKLKMVDSHQSQVKWLKDHDHIDFLDFVRTVSKFRGLQCGAAYAEGFKQCAVWPRMGTERLLP